MIGTSPHSDLRLHVSFGLPDECLKIRVEQGVCLSENLTGDPGLVFVNGQQVFGIMQLDDGDALQIGSDQFAVVFDKPEPTEDRIADEKRVALQTKEQDLSKHDTQNENATARQPAADNTPVKDEHIENTVLADLLETRDAFLLANFKASRVELPRIQVAGKDLLEDVPESIRNHHSLHAITQPDPKHRLQMWDQLKGKDAALWCLPSGNMESCLLDIKLHAAWLVRPSVLETALKNNLGDFRTRILSSFRMLVIQDNHTIDRWHLYTTTSVDLEHPSNQSLFQDA